MDNDKIDIFFPKLNHFWMDSGLLGFYNIAKEENQPPEVRLELVSEETSQGVFITGERQDVEKHLGKTYQELLARYYNTSSQKQKEEKSGFYYDSKSDKFVRFPKVKSMGIAGLIFNKAPRSTKGEVKYIKKEVIESGETVKKYLLPDSHSFLQERLDKFLLDNKLKIGSSSLLIDGPNTLQPKVEIDLQNGKPKGKCFICGEPSHSLREIGGTVFPMIQDRPEPYPLILMVANLKKFAGNAIT